MPTGQQIVNRALTTLGILEQGGTPSVSDSTDALGELNDMWSAWSIDEGLIWAEINQAFALTAGQQTYTIGPGGNFNAPIPSRIYSGYVTVLAASGASSAGLVPGSGSLAGAAIVDGATAVLGTITVAGLTVGTPLTAPGVSPALPSKVFPYAFVSAANTVTIQVENMSGSTVTVPTATYSFVGIRSNGSPATGQNRNKLEIVNANKFNSHRDLSATALIPDELYPDYNPDSSGFARISLWPVPSVLVANLELITAVAFTTWALVTVYNIPPGYADSLNWALAYRLISSFGAAVSQQIVSTVTPLGQKAELRLREANKSNRQLPDGAEILEPPQEAKQ